MTTRMLLVPLVQRRSCKPVKPSIDLGTQPRELILGDSEDCDIRILSSGLEPLHAKLTVDPERQSIRVENLGGGEVAARDKAVVNGSRYAYPGDTVSFGTSMYMVHYASQ